MEALRKHEALSTAKIAHLIGLSTRGTRTRLQDLVQRGLVIEIGSGATDPRRRYALPDTDPAAELGRTRNPSSSEGQ